MSQSTPSDKTELKPQMSPQCPFCESLGVGYKTIANKHGDQRIQAVCLSCDARGPSCDNESLSYELFDIRSELSKSSETPMSKEEPIEYKKEYNAFCPACGTYGHTSGDCQKIQKGLSSPNPLPSSPSTDKCREEFQKEWKLAEGKYQTIPENHRLALEFACWDFWQAAWQASRKECEEENARLRQEVSALRILEESIYGESSPANHIRELQVENEQLKEKLRLKEEFRRKEQSDLMKENARLKQELDKNIIFAKDHWPNCDSKVPREYASCCGPITEEGVRRLMEENSILSQELAKCASVQEQYRTQIASLQSLVEAKDNAFRKICSDLFDGRGTDHKLNRIIDTAEAALQIDQLEGKKEEDLVLPSDPSKSEPSYDMSIHSNPDARAWAKFFCKTVDEIGFKNDEEWMIGWFANAMMAQHDFMMRKPTEDTTIAEAPLNSKKSASAASTAISTEEGKG